MPASRPQKAALAAVCVLALVPPAVAHPAGAEVDLALSRIQPEAIQAHMRFLADDLLEGRGTGSRGYELAAKYVAARFEALGLKPGGEAGGYFQAVPLRKATPVADGSSLALIRDGKRTELEAGEDFLLQSQTLAEEDSSVTAPVVFVGYGVTATALGYDDYAGIDVRGKIVVLLSGAPAAFPSDQHAWYSSTLLKRENLVAHGAVGVLGVLTPEDEQRIRWENMARSSKEPGFLWLDETGQPFYAFPSVRGVGLLSRKAAEDLFAGTPRSLEQVFAGAKEGRPQSFELPVQASLRTVSRHERAESPNVAGVVPGWDPVLRDEYVVLSAHLDHMGIGAPIDGDSIYNGAYDNASGIAVLLEVAYAFASLGERPRRSLLFLAVTAEEQGLQGSDYFARHPTLPRGRIVANINLDMFLMLYPVRDVVAFGAEHSSLGKLVEPAAGRLGLTVSPDPFPEEVVFIRSDQLSFVRQGIPALFLTNGLKSDDPAATGELLMKWRQTTYHKPGDDMRQTFDFASGATFARLNFMLAWQVAQEDAAPSWNPGDFFGETFGKAAQAEAARP